MEAGRACDAKDAYSTCIETDDKSIDCRNNIVIAQKKCAIEEKALADVRGHASGAKTAETEYEAASTYRDKGLANDQERALKRCIKYDPKFVQCHIELFKIFKDRGDERNAATACKNVVKFGGQDLKADVDACTIYLKQ